MFPILQTYWQRLLFSISSTLILLSLVLAIPSTVFSAASSTPTNTLETGDSVAATSISNTINTTETKTEASSTSPTETVIPNEINDTTVGTTSTSSTLINPFELENVINDLGTTTSSNNATSTTNATTSADTGSNVASSSGTTNISTGDAISYTDILNVLNTTVVDSNGLIQFLNNVLGIKDFDLRNQFMDVFMNTNTAQSTPGCTLSACSSNSNTVTTDNNSTIVNNLVVSSDTGNNTATGSDNSIDTGNAYASANIINVANTNIIDSEYLLLVFNNFSDLAGNLILPNSDFFTKLFKNANPGIVSNDNTAIVNNSVQVLADSGNNAATGSSTDINTGTATSIGTINNTVNQNFIGSNSFSMVIRVFGDWSGNVFGLPEGMSWENTPAGIRIFSTSAGNSGSGDTSVQTHNNASVQNNVQVYALTGDNYANGERTNINTGNAYANASIMNLLNTNIVGSNWASLIFNIYGNWSGNISFGESDLWLGVRATSPDTPIMPGSPVTYTYTIFNHGDLTAHNLRLVTNNERGALAFGGGNIENDIQAGLDRHSVDIGTLAPGETREITQTAQVNDALPRRSLSAIPLQATVTADEPDSNDTDNTDTVTITVGANRNKSSKPGGSMEANIHLTKTANLDQAQPGNTVTYKINVNNSAGPLHEAVLVDILEASDGTIVNEQFIPLGDLVTNAAIDVSYDTALSSTIATGTYTNTAQVIGFDGSSNIKYQQSYSSPIATHKLIVGTSSDPVGLVLGAYDSCTPYLEKYLRLGQHNDSSEVAKLQTFINEELDSRLNVSGIFDAKTEEAVKAFQKKYSGDILDPWRTTTPTGYVYYTTQKKINELYCNDAVPFPLTQQQLTDIARVTSGSLNKLTNNSFKNTLATRPRFTETSIPNTPIAPFNSQRVNDPDNKNQVRPAEKLPEKKNIWNILNWWLQRTTEVFSMR